MTTKLEDQIAGAETPDDDGGDGGDGDAEASPEISDEDEADDAEGAPPEAEPAELAPSAQANMAAIEKEIGRRVKALRAIFDDFDATHEECPVCTAMGYLPSSPLKADSRVTKCEECAGFGTVRTGAVNPATATRQCPVCIGNGYVPTGEAEAPQVTFQTNGGTDTSAQPPEDPTVVALRAQGYTVLPPFTPSVAS